MSNTERPVIEWLRTIADPIVRESAVRQCVDHKTLVRSLVDALYMFNSWNDTKEGHKHWEKIKNLAVNGQLATIAPAATNWMDEVHTMD